MVDLFLKIDEIARTCDQIYMFRIFIDMFLIKVIWRIFKVDYEHDKALPFSVHFV
jgi:hypothetical protein